MDKHTYEIIKVVLEETTIKVLYVNWIEPNPEDYASEHMHSHGFYEVHGCYGQDVSVRINGKMVRLKNQQVIIISPGTLHNAADPAARKLIFSYSIEENNTTGYFENQLLAFDEPYQLITGIDTGRLINISEEIENRKSGYFESVKAHFSLLLVDIIRARSRMTGICLPKTIRPKYDDEFLLDMFFKSNNRIGFNKDTLANLMHVSKRQLERKIFAVYGMTFREKVNQARFQNAILMLEHKQFTAQEVSEALGYTNIYSFLRAFEKYTGKSVSDYIKDDI